MSSIVPISLLILFIGFSTAFEPFRPDPSFQKMSVIVKSLEYSLRNNNVEAVAHRFDDEFSFKSCDGTYGKVDFIRSLLVLPMDPSFYFQLKRSVSSWNRTINIRVEVFGINGMPFSIYLRWSHAMKFTSGYMDNCRRF